MITFIVALIVLVVGFFTYGTLVEKIFGIEPERKTPALTKTDGVDFVPMAPWRIFLVQFLNIAGLGPIFGAIMGIFYGPAAFLWIVFGTIFAGAVHDYFYYTDYTMKSAHRSNRMLVTLDNENWDKVSISVYKFKRFLRHKFNNGEIIV